MSRSNPTSNISNPSTRWFEWKGDIGSVIYYDKNKPNPQDGKPGCNVRVPDGFTFLLLDELKTVKGWHERSKSGIMANEVRNTTLERMAVKAFKGGILAEGFYADIKEKVAYQGGWYSASCYIAYRNEIGALCIGNIQFAGSSLSVWMEFCKNHRSELDKKGIRIKGKTHHEKGTGSKKIEWDNPIFTLCDTSETTNAEAIELDRQLQKYLEAYFRRATPAVSASTESEPEHHSEPTQHQPETEPAAVAPQPPEDDVPF